jgi:protein-S-isoprenylcysteine O-methyltransferase Ste14
VAEPGKRKRRGLRRWLKSTSRRTFVLYPIVVILFESLRQGLPPYLIDIQPLGAVLLLWGYLQYRQVGRYRTELGGGGPGLEVPPDRIVEVGPYRYVRNPMYLGHLIFMLGLAITFRSWLALAILLFHIFWFERRVREDEAHLEARFGEEYRDYKRRVKRWLPGLY